MPRRRAALRAAGSSRDRRRGRRSRAGPRNVGKRSTTRSRPFPSATRPTESTRGVAASRPELRPQRARPGHPRRRLRDSVRPHFDPFGSIPASTTLVPLTGRRCDRDSCSPDHATVDSVVKQVLEHDLAQFRPDHAQALEHVGDAASATPPGGPGRRGSLVAEDMDDVGSWQLTQLPRKAGGESDPPEPQGCCEVAYCAPRRPGRPARRENRRPISSSVVVTT